VLTNQHYKGVNLEKGKELSSHADADQRELVPLIKHSRKMESEKHVQACISTPVDLAAQSAVQQCNPFHTEPVALAPQKEFARS